MSDYRRLISYIYEYEGKEKGKNVGFVKLEARNGQCRLNLSVKKVYMGSSAIGVFLLSKAGTEVFLGNIFIRSGAGEFRAVVDAKNVEGNGGGLDTYYGLTIHDVKNPWRSYTTIWEDAVEPETLPGSLPGDQGNGDTVKMLPAEEILPGSPDQSEEEPVMAVASVVREIEAEIAGMDPEEKEMFLSELGLHESGLDRLIKVCYDLLGLMSYLTAGEQEVRAWTIEKGTKAPQAAGKIHTDFERGFIRAEVINYKDLIELGSLAAAREKGLVRSEGKEYVMQDGDVVLFRFNV